ncbi:hypothetical protein [Pseudomonas lini]
MHKTERFSDGQLARERSWESWLVGQVALAYDALKDDSSYTLSIEQVRSRLSAEHQKAQVEIDE